MYVCLCNGVTESDVREAIAAGADTVEEVAYCTGAGTRCGTCRNAVSAMVEHAQREAGHGCHTRLRVLTSAA